MSAPISARVPAHVSAPAATGSTALARSWRVAALGFTLSLTATTALALGLSVL